MTDRPVRALLWANRLVGDAQNATGVGRYAVEVTQSLATGARPITLGLGSCRERDAVPPWVPGNVTVHRMPWSRRLVHTAWLASSWPKVERTRFEPDLLHVLYPSFPVPSEAPVLYTIHDVLPITNPEWYKPWVRRGFRRSLADARHRAAVTITNSHHVASSLIEHFGFDPGRIRTIYPGISERFSVRMGDEAVKGVLSRHALSRPYVLHVGMLTQRKQLPTLVRALAAAESISDVDLVLAGPDRGEASTVRALAHRLGVGPRVHMLGVVSDPELAALVQRALALVHPALDEGFGFTPLEAMAAGTAAVVSGRGSLREVTGDAALHVGADADAWAEAITRVVTDNALAELLRARGREHASQFSWTANASALFDVYAAVAGGVDAHSQTTDLSTSS